MASLAPEDIDITQNRVCTFNAADLTRAWLAVALASGEDETRPVLNRTVLLEFHDKGARLVATDNYILLTCFVPYFDSSARTDLSVVKEPTLDEAPLDAVVAIDGHGRGAGLMKHLLGLSRAADKDGLPPIEISVRVGAPAQEPRALAFAGFERKALIFDYPGHEEVALLIHESAFPGWRPFLIDYKPTPTKALAINPELLTRAAKLGKYFGSPLALNFGGPLGMVHLSVGPVIGGVMPVNAPEVTDQP